MTEARTTSSNMAAAPVEARGREATNGEIPDRLMAASWEVDISETGPWVAAINEHRRTGGDGDPAHLTTLCLQLHPGDPRGQRQRTRVATCRGQPWPRADDRAIGGGLRPIENRATFAQMIVEAVNAGAPNTTYQREVPSNGVLRDPSYTLWLIEGPEFPNRAYIAVNGTVDDDRSYLFLRASEARYRKLVQYMPMAMWQVDASHMGRIYREIRAEGVEDFDAYLNRASRADRLRRAFGAGHGRQS